jgi:hypothetical protein
MLVAAGAGSGGGSAQDSTGWSQGGGGLPRHAHGLPLPLQDPMARDGREAAADARSGGGSGVVVARRWWAMPVIFFVCLPCVPQRSARQRYNCLSCVFRPGARQTWTRCRLAPSPSLTFCLSCVLINARQRFFTVPSGGRHELYRAKRCRVPFVVRLDKKRTAKPLLCVF